MKKRSREAHCGVNDAAIAVRNVASTFVSALAITIPQAGLARLSACAGCVLDCDCENDR